jgi:hypothetical protein
MQAPCGGSRLPAALRLLIRRLLILRFDARSIYTLRSQIRISNRSQLLVICKSAQLPGIGLELWRSSADLPRVPQNHPGPSVHRLYSPANLYILVCPSLS